MVPKLTVAPRPDGTRVRPHAISPKFTVVMSTAPGQSTRQLGGATNPHASHNRIPPMKERVRPLLEAAAKDYVSKNQPWPKRTEPCDKAS